MKKNSAIPMMHFIGAVHCRRWRARFQTRFKTLFQALFLLLAISAIHSAKAFAEVENCPDPANIRFDNTTYQWLTTEQGWKSDSKPRHVTDLGGVTLKSVKLKIDHEEGDVVGCSYDADNGEHVIFTKGGSAKDSSGSIIRSEIIPGDVNNWNNDAARKEFVCQLSSGNCSFDVVVPLPDADSLKMAGLLQPVRLYLAPGTAFVAHACGNGPEGVACIGPLHVNGTYFLKHSNSKFCLEVNRFAGLVWAQYYFQVEEGYQGEQMKWWGASVDPKYTLPKGIRYLTTNVSGNFTSCGLLNLSN